VIFNQRKYIIVDRRPCHVGCKRAPLLAACCRQPPRAVLLRQPSPTRLPSRSLRQSPRRGNHAAARVDLPRSCPRHPRRSHGRCGRKPKHGFGASGVCGLERWGGKRRAGGGVRRRGGVHRRNTALVLHGLVLRGGGRTGNGDGRARGKRRRGGGRSLGARGCARAARGARRSCGAPRTAARGVGVRRAAWRAVQAARGPASGGRRLGRGVCAGWGARRRAAGAGGSSRRRTGDHSQAITICSRESYRHKHCASARR